VVIGMALVVVGALGTVHRSGVTWAEWVVGVVALPLLMVGAGGVVGRYRSDPLRLTGPLATGVNCLVIVALSGNGVTGPAIELFYGVTLLAAAWRGQPDCEVTVISNLALGRDDQVGCPLFSLIDHSERRRRGRAVPAQPASPADAAVETPDWTWPG
jgi:hypothetical protein